MKILVLVLGMVSGAAQAGWRPVIHSDNLSVAVNYGGGTASYAESRIGAAGPLGRVVNQLKALPYDLQQALNGRVAPMINQNGASFQNGTVSGNAVVTLQPAASGVTYLSVSGLNYQVTSHFSARKWGVIKADCTNTLTLSNIAVTGQYGSVNGVLDRDKVGVMANVASSTDCDSNLSWILPVVGDMLVRKGEGMVDAALKSKVADSLTNFKDALLFKPDQNWLVGLNQLVPGDKVVQLPGGGSFPIGQYVRNNMQYLVGNSQITLRLGDWLPPFKSDPDANGKVDVVVPQNYSSEVLSLSLSSPAASFSIKVNEVANVGWKWDGTFCGGRNSRMTCVEP